MDRLKILVVDDEPDIVRALRMRLVAQGYEVLTASDGMQATTIAIKQQPALVILDLGMPGGDGFVVVERLRASARTNAIPILILTARAGEAERERARAMGVERYLTKPFDARQLLATVTELITHTVGAAPAPIV
jgi:DNA-binding response OmpR family regulator